MCDGTNQMIAETGAKKPSRKHNRIKQYDYSRNGAYFVTICTHGRAQRFEIGLSIGNGTQAVFYRTSSEIKRIMMKYGCILKTIRANG